MLAHTRSKLGVEKGQVTFDPSSASQARQARIHSTVASSAFQKFHAQLVINEAELPHASSNSTGPLPGH
jgi:hypothetical protein